MTREVKITVTGVRLDDTPAPVNTSDTEHDACIHAISRICIADIQDIHIICIYSTYAGESGKVRTAGVGGRLGLRESAEG